MPQKIKWPVLSWLFPVTACVLLVACGSTPGPRDSVPSASFKAEILADGTKLFAYSERRMMQDEEMVGRARELAERRGESSRATRAPARSAKAAQRDLEEMLMHNRYCRDGYVVLEQYEGRSGHVIRGECRDAATADDRQRFSASRE